MRRLEVVLMASVAAGSPTLACAYNTCAVSEPRQATVDAAGAAVVRVEAKAGSLRITGEAGLDQLLARGTACAENQRALEKVQLRASRSGDEVRVVVEMPDNWGEGGALDLELQVPEGLAVDVQDASGEIDVDGVASLRLEDGSGEIDVTKVRGDVRIRDGSGAIDLTDVAGDVDVHDGSGEIEIVGVAKDVLIRRDSSGGIRVEDVGGDFTVEKDSSGGIAHKRVKGRVDVPE